MVKNKKNISQEEQFTDEYFLNLTMDYDERDDEIYPKWAIWCAKSQDKYYIDGKDHRFYTHVRTLDEIDIERKRRELNNILFTQDHDESEEELWLRYERYIHNISCDDYRVRTIVPKSFEEWKESHSDSE